MKRFLTALVLFLGIASTADPAGFCCAAPPAVASAFSVLPIGAGGQLTGIDIQCDQGVGICNNSGTTTKVVRTDTYGAWLYDNTASNCGNANATGCWQQLITATSFPDSLFNLQGNGNCCGVYELRVAPSNTQIMYMYFNTFVYKTVNHGSTWTKTAFASLAAAPNQSTKFEGPYIAIDPANSNIVIVGTPTNGVRYTLDGGATWTSISTGTIAAGGVVSGGYLGSPAQHGGNVIAFDPTSSVVGGATQGIYICSYGTGCYHGTGGIAGSFTLTTSTPTTFIHIFCDQNGSLWLTDNTNFETGTNINLHKYTGTWAAISDGVVTGRNTSISVNPNTSGSSLAIAIGQDAGCLNTSFNNGSTWNSCDFSVPTTRTATDIPYLANTNEIYMTNGDMKFDPSGSNLLWFAEGIGAWTTNPPAAITTAWTSKSAKIEQLVANWIISPPSGTPIVTAWDRPIFRTTLPVYPTNHGTNYIKSIQLGASADWIAGTPTTIVAIADWFDGENSGKSTDGGQTWSVFGTFPSGAIVNGGNGFGGCIAASTTTHYLWMLADDGGTFYTKDGGATWAASTISGVSNTDSGWSHAYYLDRQNCVADRVTADTYYIYNDGSNGFGGVYRSTDGGVNFSKVVTGAFDGNGNNIVMRSVIGVAGNFYYSSGNVVPAGTQLMYECQDTAGTITCPSISNGSYAVTDVWAFDLGKAKPGGSGYPTIIIYGAINGVFGYWESDNHHTTWFQIGSTANANGSLDQVKVIGADANTYGNFYVGVTGSGFLKYVK